MEEIRVTYEKYHYNILILLDELFAVNKARAVDFCAGIQDGRVKYGWDFDWMFQTHANAHLDLETMEMMKRSGCIFFSYGLESASPKVLKSIDKKIKPEQVAEAIEMAEKAGLGFSANLIFGDPVETEETIAESLQFWLKYGQRQNIFLAQDMRPYPGSKIFNYCLEKGLIKDKREYYETIDQKPINMTGMSNKDWEEFLRLIATLERSWVFVKKARNVKFVIEPPGNSIIERNEGGRFLTIKAVCPHCGGNCIYREFRAQPEQPFYLGLNCLHCQKRMRIDVGNV